MQRGIVFSVIVAGLLCSGCGGESSEEKHVSIEKVSIEKVADSSQKVLLESVASRVSDMAKTVSDKEVAKSVLKVDKARAEAGVVMESAVLSLEKEGLDQADIRVDAKALHAYQQEAYAIMQEEVYKVEAAKAASSARIAASVKSVMDARASMPAANPLSASVLQVVKAKATSHVAKAVSSVEIAKASSSSSVAKATADVAMHKRVYGESSVQVDAAKAQASGIIAAAVGKVKVAEAQALGVISESVAEVEIAKAKSGMVRDEVVKGQKIYLKQMKKICGINGAIFAAKHTQAEWKGLFEEGAFAQEAQKICPQIKVFDQHWSKKLFEFAYEYASDSGHVPSCG